MESVSHAGPACSGEVLVSRNYRHYLGGNAEKSFEADTILAVVVTDMTECCAQELLKAMIHIVLPQHSEHGRASLLR